MEVDQEMEPPGPASHAPSSTHISTQQSSTSEEKDLGDVFHLSQLLFVVGHVAIKHIVFLELVEREWKRQKDEKQLGMFTLQMPSNYRFDVLHRGKACSWGVTRQSQ
jgi:condensin complex subunit 1